MGFEKFGQKSFTSRTKVDDFVEYLANGELRGTKCKSCAQSYFPPRADCPGCLGGDMEWLKIEGTGRLISYTRANYAPTGFEADVPYTLALVDFNGIKVFGRLSSAIPEEELSPGISLRTSISQLPGARLTYEFVKTEQ
ncbi:MAG: Zn-ribbon domain-containing OB-fold protein [Firmicutes bacterium]|nr:Zn-ribbon domain-containing OB-fold protein [Bacillota bacterium]